MQEGKEDEVDQNIITITASIMQVFDGKQHDKEEEALELVRALCAHHS
jgi:hypothetical protein